MFNVCDTFLRYTIIKCDLFAHCLERKPLLPLLLFTHSLLASDGRVLGYSRHAAYDGTNDTVNIISDIAAFAFRKVHNSITVLVRSAVFRFSFHLARLHREYSAAAQPAKLGFLLWESDVSRHRLSSLCLPLEMFAPRDVILYIYRLACAVSSHRGYRYQIPACQPIPSRMFWILTQP